MSLVLVPELSVRDLSASLQFYCGPAGFKLRYERHEDHFAYLERGSAELMLDQLGTGRDWITASLEPPFGRGVNFQIEVSNINETARTFTSGGHLLFQPIETKTYRAGARTVSQRQFCVLDPDGYLLRFCQILPQLV